MYPIPTSLLIPRSNSTAVLILLLSAVPSIPSRAAWHERVQQFWTAVFPSYGEGFGVQALGLVMLVLGSVELSRK